MENYNFLTCLALVSENFTCLINFGLNHASLINPLLSSSQSWKKKRSKGIPATMVFCLPSGPSLASLKCSLLTTWVDLYSNVEWDYRMFPFIICSCSVILIVSYGGLILENCWCLYVKISCLPQFLCLPPAPLPILFQKISMIKISFLQVDFIQAKVSPPLSLNATNVKHAREYVKELAVTREKESIKRKAVDKLRVKEPKNKGKIVSLNPL